MGRPCAKVGEIKVLLGEGLTHLQISVRLGVATTTVSRVHARMREADEKAREPTRFRPPAIAVRCPGCGGLTLVQPCAVCALRERLAARRKG